MKPKIIRILSIIIFSFCGLVGTTLATLSIWADLEASLFDPSIPGDETLKTLSCPVFINSTETGIISAKFYNPTSRPLELFIRTHITEGYVTLMREINEHIPIESGESKELEWQITSKDAAFGRLVLVRVYSFRTYGIPSRHATCGVVIMNSTLLTGFQVLFAAILISVLGILGSIILWQKYSRSLGRQGQIVYNALLSLGGTILLSIIISLLGLWLPGIVIVVFTLLLTGGILGYFVLSY